MEIERVTSAIHLCQLRDDCLFGRYEPFSKHRGIKMKSIAVSIVRNCEDIIALTVLHHCLLGVDHCIVIDNGSTDRTADLLGTISKKLPRVMAIRDPSPFQQAKIVGNIINEFTRRQRTLVIVFDADECWNASVERIENFFETEGVNVAECDVVNFVQSRSVTRPSPFSWLKIHRRTPVVLGEERALVRERKHSFIEVKFPRKLLFCAEGAITISTGAHHVEFEGSSRKYNARFQCFHLPLRSRTELEKRAYDYEPRRAPFRPSEQISWQSLHFRETLERNEAEAEWRANSYDRSSHIDVFGRATKTMADFRLVGQLGKAYAYGLYLNVPMWPRPT
jgi:glycosyl transferase family 2